MMKMATTTRKGRSKPSNLREQVDEGAMKMWPTPTANEDAAGTPAGNMQKMLGNDPRLRGTTPEEWADGTLNPQWVEWLMGYPAGWTDLKDSETPSFPKSPPKFLE